MKGINILNMTAGMAAVLLSVTLFSCSSDVPYEHTDYSTTDNICFGISDSGNGTRAAAANEAITTDRYVLRSSESSDTLCVRAVVSDGIGKAAAKHATRASMQTTMYDQFNVVAQLKKSDGNIAPRYYMNEVATKQGVVWQPSSSIYYWPDNGSLRFLAWAPLDAELDESPVKPSEDVNKTTIKYTVPAELSKQRDLVAAATGYNASPAGGVCAPVSLQFKHLCTAVVVKTGATMAPGTIKSVTVTNVRNSGTYDMLRSAWTLNDATTSYTVSPNMATGSTTAEGTKLNADDATFMLLPQTLGADSKLEVMFHDNISGRDRLLTASLNGAEWPMGKTVTYRLSITPEYELEFTSEPQVQDAHYVIYPIKIKVDPGLSGGWRLKSTSPKVTLCKELTELTSLGYWIEEDRGTQAIEGTETGEITVYAFIEENVTNAERDLVLELSPKGIPSATPAKFTIRQLCPSWNTDGLGCERFEDGKYPWGFLWDSSMKITYDMRDAGGHGFWGPLRRWIMKIQIKYYGDKYKDYITYTQYWLQLETVTIDFSKVPNLDVADNPDDGNLNTWELYNFNGISDVTGLMTQLEAWGGKPDKHLAQNPAEYAARLCTMKNKFNKELLETDAAGNKTYRPVLKRENLVWYLPAKNEFSMVVDNEYPLTGDYWTSTASEVAHDNENSYKYLYGSGASLQKRTTLLNVRAVRKRP
ncbi:fimbrillin family protein [Prevotella stercorea]|uniref:fimbrillin family protein n=1 Tax=Leyella stercorea TaxID=363265 RepID=UPI001C2C9308|nr:fimbrillin family protein [Leyella stercorea]MBU9899602.1 fimbrillin family protein [Leyella stercorea]MBU9947605.1 fimbrillin family protein [Leyella stercorea]